jgi:hypothetical protein
MSVLTNKKSISFKTIFILFGIFTGLLTGLRIYQLVFNTETDKSGFFIKNDWSVFAFYICAAVFLAVIYLLVQLSSNVTASKSPRGKNKYLAVGSALLAAGLAFDVAINISEVIKAVTSYVAGENLLAFLMANGLLASAIGAVCGLLGIIYFILFALSYFDGKTTFNEYKMLAIAPLFWSMFRIVRRFMTKISFTVLADLLIELVMLIFMMLFFMSFARVSSQICQKYEMRKAMKYGLCAAMFAFVLGVSRLVGTFAKSGVIATDFGFNPADLAFGIFTVLYVNACSKTGRPASDDELIEDEEEKKAQEEEIDDDFLND